MVALTPFLKEYVGQYMPAKHKVLLSEFDRVGNDFKGHQQEIHVKLVAIMNERFSIHIKAMQVIQWDVDDTMGKQANIYMETLVKETMTLHKVLSKYLPSTDLQVKRIKGMLSFLSCSLSFPLPLFFSLSWSRFSSLLLPNSLKWLIKPLSILIKAKHGYSRMSLTSLGDSPRSKASSVPLVKSWMPSKPSKSPPLILLDPCYLFTLAYYAIIPPFPSLFNVFPPPVETNKDPLLDMLLSF
jgi:hypothetical protein